MLNVQYRLPPPPQEPPKRDGGLAWALFSLQTADALLQRLGFLCAALAALPPATRLGDVGAMPAAEGASVLAMSRCGAPAETQVPDGQGWVCQAA